MAAALVVGFGWIGSPRTAPAQAVSAPAAATVGDDSDEASVPQSGQAPGTIPAAARPDGTAADGEATPRAAPAAKAAAAGPATAAGGDSLWPIAVLAIGMAIVLTMIVGLKINAFLALLTAALVVSLLASGEGDAPVVRVTESLGKHAGNIGVIIAMAAIIGDCMLRSGAADRIVRFFLAVFGQKRAGVALASSGFVLAIPVFFDTVFYLLVPLARSLYRRTGTNYVKYLLAIVVGGATTHALVPPTPGPLLIAANLNFDVGWMIVVGTIIGLPTAAAGLVVAGMIDRLMPIPMRPIGGEPEDDVPGVPDPVTADPAAVHASDHPPHGVDVPADAVGVKPIAVAADEEAIRREPPLLLALLPVALPVILIAANTLLTTLADNDHTPLFDPADRATTRAVATAIADDAATDPDGVGARIVDRLRAVDARAAELAKVAKTTDRPAALPVAPLLTPGRELTDAEAMRLATVLDQRILSARDFYAGPNDPAFSGLSDPTATKLAGENRARMRQALVERMNRLMLEQAYPDAVPRHVWETPLRTAADWTTLVGNSNVALILATVIALSLVVRAEGSARDVLAGLVERSLMSAGVIILITASGGAFGDMLTAAGVGDAIKSLFAGDGAQVSGLMMLVLGFAIASILKVAQGSTTVAMITASGMLAGTAQAELLGFHPVYLAVAIAGGSTVGSWMNDSGFWIFAKMGGLTEWEALRSWTIGLATVGIVSFLLSVIGALLVPLV